MSTNHSQGPWDVNEFVDLEGERHVTVVVKSNGCPIAHLYELGVETRPNARLLAASPEMHGALIELAQAAQDAYEEALREVPEGFCVPPWIVRLQQGAERAHAALVRVDARFNPLRSATAA
jgi:hypothetical protein